MPGKILINKAVEELQRNGIKSLCSKTWDYTKFHPLIFDMYAKFLTNYLQFKYDYNHLAHPYSTISVDPTSIDKMSPREGTDFWNDFGHIRGGSWDRPVKPFGSYDLVQAYHQRFLEDIPWRETKFYDRVTCEIRDGNIKWGASSVSEFERRLSEIEQLYIRIRDKGYKRSCDVDKNKLKTNQERNFLNPRIDEVTVDIDRSGQLLFVDGRNRLAIAQVLNLDSIPVMVNLRHDKWQSVREAVGRGESACAFSDHPDLIDIIY